MPPKPLSPSFDLGMMIMQIMGDKETAFCLELAIDRLKQYEVIVQRQNKRIWEAQRRAIETAVRLHKPKYPRKTNLGRVRHYMKSSEEQSRWFSISNAEAHFYLIAWDTVSKVIQTLIEGGSGLEAPKQIWKVHQTKFKEYKDARDHLEHWIERLPGKKRHTWAISDSGGMKTMSGNMGRVRVEGKFTFRNDDGQDVAVDISSDSAKMLNGICRQLRENLTAEVQALFQSGKTIPQMRSRRVVNKFTKNDANAGHSIRTVVSQP